MTKTELIQKINDAKLTKSEIEELTSFIGQMVSLEVSMSNEGHPLYR